MRLGFFRLMHADLHAIRFALHEMEKRGQKVCDCSAAGLSKEEPLANIREICHDWKQPFRAAYSAGNNFKQLVATRNAVEAAMRAPAPEPKKAEPTPAPVVAAVAPVTKAESPKPQPVAPTPSAAPATPAISIDTCLEQIAEQLLNVKAGTKPVSNVVVGTTKLLLASWEVAAFTHGGDDIADTLQRAVAARVILSMAVEQKRANATADLKSAIGIAHAEAGQIQERIAEAKDAKNIDAAVNLAATSKRLLTLVAEAEKLG